MLRSVVCSSLFPVLIPPSPSHPQVCQHGTDRKRTQRCQLKWMSTTVRTKRSQNLPTRICLSVCMSACQSNWLADKLTFPTLSLCLHPAVPPSLKQSSPPPPTCQSPFCLSPPVCPLSPLKQFPTPPFSLPPPTVCPSLLKTVPPPPTCHSPFCLSPPVCPPSPLKQFPTPPLSLPPSTVCPLPP